MIDHADLPPISTVLSMLGAKVSGKRATGACHGGKSPGVISFDDERGIYYCHRCAQGGDAITLIQQTLDTDYHGACQWLGIIPGAPSIPDPVAMRREQIHEGLRKRARFYARELRYEHYVRGKVEVRAIERLRQNPEDESAWNWLGWAYTGLEAIVHMLDLLEGTEEQQMQAYEEMRRRIAE